MQQQKPSLIRMVLKAYLTAFGLTVACVLALLVHIVETLIWIGYENKQSKRQQQTKR